MRIASRMSVSFGTVAMSLAMVVALSALLPEAHAQRAVKDINTTPLKSYHWPARPYPARVDPGREQQFARMGAWTYFPASASATGNELFRTNGTKVELVKDIYPGPYGSTPMQLTVIRGRLYFGAQEPLHGRELWVSDGTEKGTKLFADFEPGPDSSGPSWATAMSKGRILCSQGIKGLGISDGTVAGTKLIAPNLGAFVANGLQAVNDGSLAYFGYAGQIWVTDGSTQGTRLLKNLSHTGSSVHLRPIGPKRMLFQDIYSHEIWATQGTAKTTVRLLTLSSYTEESRQGLRYSTTYKGKVWFTGTLPYKNLHSLYFTDGTLKGTGTIYTAGNNERLTALVLDANRLWFARDLRRPYRTEIWTSDGTVKGTKSWASVPVRPVVTICPTGGKVFMRGYSRQNGNELWVTDGTKAGTSLVRDIVAGNKSSNPSFVTAVASGQVFFAADDGTATYKIEAWTSKGTAKSTQMLDFKAWAKIPGTADDWVHNIVGLSGKVLFTAVDGKVGSELWRSDGTAKGTVLLKDIWPGPKSSRPLDLCRLGDKVLFGANDGKSGAELWVSDGTSQGTRLLKDIEPGAGGSSPRKFIATKGRVYFQATTSREGAELWVSDGTSVGTRIVKDVFPGRLGLSQPEFAVLPDGKILFTHMKYSKPFGTSYWVSDGTAQGTQRILFVPTSPPPFWGSTRPYAYKGRFYFRAADSKNGIELWVSDGTPKGTHLFVNIASDAKGVTSGNPSDLFTLGGYLYFQAYSQAHGRALWRSDGTPSGTRYHSKFSAFTRLKHLSGNPVPFTNVGSRHVYFPATDPKSRRTLASLDTQGKVRFFPQIQPGGQAMPYKLWYVESLAVQDGALWFAAEKTFRDHQLFVLRDHAVASQLGHAMASTTLSSSDPVQGQSASIVAETGMSQPVLMVMLGLRARRPLAVPPFYLLYYDHTSFTLPVGIGLGNKITINLPIPLDKSLTGAKAMLQAWSLDPRRFPQGLELSNAVHWYVGR